MIFLISIELCYSEPDVLIYSDFTKEKKEVDDDDEHL